MWLSLTTIRGVIGWRRNYSGALHATLGVCFTASILAHTITKIYMFPVLSSLMLVVFALIISRLRALKAPSREERSAMCKSNQITIFEKLLNDKYDYWYLVDGKPTRVAWISRKMAKHDSVTLYHVAQPERRTAAGRASTGAPAEDATCVKISGPFPLPRTPYASWPGELGMRCAEGGIFSCLAVLRRRQLAGNMLEGRSESGLLHTIVEWFSNDRKLVEFVHDQVHQSGSGSWLLRVFYYGQDPIPSHIPQNNCPPALKAVVDSNTRQDTRQKDDGDSDTLHNNSNEEDSHSATLQNTSQKDNSDCDALKTASPTHIPLHVPVPLHARHVTCWGMEKKTLAEAVEEQYKRQNASISGYHDPEVIRKPGRTWGK